MAPIYLGKRVLPSSFRYIENLAFNHHIYIIFYVDNMVIFYV